MSFNVKSWEKFNWSKQQVRDIKNNIQYHKNLVEELETKLEAAKIVQDAFFKEYYDSMDEHALSFFNEESHGKEK